MIGSVNMKINAIILAAGRGTRMKSKLYKVLHPVLGKPMINHLIDHIKETEIKRKIIVIAKNSDQVKEAVKENVEFVVQEEQLGTGHAVMMVEPLLKDEEGITLVICGDTPLISSDTINRLINFHSENHADITVLSTMLEDPTNYGRIIRDNNNSVLKIVEHKDANEEEKQVREINTATYCFDNKKLFKSLKKIRNQNSQNEFYLTDIIEIIKNEDGKVYAYITDNNDEVMGINDKISLSLANSILKRTINDKMMRNGVTIVDPNNTYISADTLIGKDTIIYPGTILYGENVIGEDCKIGPNTEFLNVKVGNNVNVKHSVLANSVIGNNTNVGPFAHFRNNAVIGNNVRIGNFVEIKNSQFGDSSNAAHLSYIGDSEVGSKVNMGCGTITVNYDGNKKSKTIIKDNAFVGCNSNLIAPVTIGENAYVAAGSTINKDVPKGALAIARQKQENKDGYSKKLRK